MVLDSALITLLRQLLDGAGLAFVFQPIVRLADPEVIGYEALMRGPEGSPLESPLALLEVAHAAGATLELERMATLGAIAAFARLNLPGRLFLNVGSSTVESFAADMAGTGLLRTVAEHGFSPGRIVLELTEYERVLNPESLLTALSGFAGHGIHVAIDDFGDGRSSLRLWTQLRPALVKLDRYFVHDIHFDGRKVEIVRALLRLAESFHTELVAEGVEHPAELAVLRDLGCHYAQGFYFSRPQALPDAAVSASAREILRSHKIAVLPGAAQHPGIGETLEALALDAPPVAPGMSNEDLLALFGRLPDLHAVAVVDQQIPFGIINRQAFLEKCTQRFHRELYGNKSCCMHMRRDPQMIDRATPINSLINVLAGENQRYLYDGIILTDGGRYAGLVTGETLVRAVTERRVEAARHANPLTLLPGNLPITEHIRRLLSNNHEFCAAYFDLNNFKPFNDLYGYWRGDQMIKLFAEVATRHVDPSQDFLGHVGGDDFVVLFQSEDWLTRCETLVSEFNQRARGLFDAPELERNGMAGEDRHGYQVMFPLTTVSAGVVQVVPALFQRPEDVASAAARAKKRAKESKSGIEVLEGERRSCAQVVLAG